MRFQEAYFENLNMVCHLGGYFAPAYMEVWERAPHTFTQNKFYCIKKGHIRLVIAGVEYEGKAGDWFFIPAGTEHSYSNFPEEPFEKYWMHFDLYPSAALTSLLNLPHKVRFPENGAGEKLFKEYVRLAESKKLTDIITVKAILTALLAEYIRLSHPEEEISVGNMGDERMDEILDFIRKNLDKPLSVSDLSEKFHFHPNHFIRFFKSRTGQTPARYIKILKMETAKRYLEKTDLYVTEIMEKIGQTDAASFSKQFKSMYSMSPMEYRRYFRQT